MYLFFPVINKVLSILSQTELKLVLTSTIGTFAFCRRYKIPNKDIFNLSRGDSILWLLTLYIGGSYIGKYKKDYNGIKKYLYCLICLFIYVFSTYIISKVFNNELYIRNKYYTQKIVWFLKKQVNDIINYDSSIKMIQSISITLFFMQLKYNKYLSYIITFFGRLSFGIYLSHVNQLVNKNIFHKVLKN